MSTILYILVPEEEEQEESKPVTKKEKTQPNKKPKSVSKQKGKSSVAFTHEWLAGSLKGHSSRILDMDFSPNGKYVITVAEGSDFCFVLHLLVLQSHSYNFKYIVDRKKENYLLVGRITRSLEIHGLDQKIFL